MWTPDRDLKRAHALEHVTGRFDGRLHVTTGFGATENQHGHLPMSKDLPIASSAKAREIARLLKQDRRHTGADARSHRHAE